MLKKMKLALRLGVAFGVMLALLVAVGSFALRQMNMLSRLNADLYEHPFTVKSAVLLIDANIMKINKLVNSMAVASDPAEIARELAELDQLGSASSTQFRIIEERFLGSPSMYRRAEELFGVLKPLAREVAELARSGEPGKARALARGQGAGAVIDAVTAMNKLQAFAEGKASEFYQASKVVRDDAFATMWGAIALAVLVGLGFTIVFTRSVSTPAQEIAAVAEAIAAGDLTRRITYSGDDEIGKMAASLRNMLAGVIGEGQSIKNGITSPFWTADRNLVITFMNEAAAEIAFDCCGLPAARIVGRKTVSDVFSDEGGLMAKLAETCLATGQQQENELVFDFDGELTILHQVTSRLLDQNNRVIGVMGMGVDISARREAEANLQQREALLNDVGAMAKIGGWEIDLDSGLSKWTRATFDICEVSAKDGAPRQGEFIDSYLPEYRAGIVEQMQRLIERDHPMIFEAQFITGKGNIKWARVQGWSERHGDRCVRVYGAFQDVTEQKNAERERALLEAQLRQSQKMEAIGTLAGGVAHDFNNILSAIIGYSELSLMDLEQSAPLRANLEQVLKSSWRARDLVAQLLAYSRKQVLKLSTFGMQEVISRNEPMLRRILGEDIDLETALGQDTGMVRADMNQIEQVLLNLVANARDAMPTGGKITLETANVFLDESYVSTHAEATVGPHVMLAVSDNGPGMDEKIRDRIFDPFFTTKGAGKGTGLGLAMVYGIVKQHGGSIYVYTELGQGTTFKIYLPQALDGQRQAAESSSLLLQPVGGEETILVVEDDDVVRDFTSRMLERLGYEVLAASDGDEAIEIMASDGASVDLLLTDVIMPKMSGKELAERLAANWPGLKVLYISGYTDNVIAHHGVLDAGVAFLQKPATLHTLASKVRQVLDD